MPLLSERPAKNAIVGFAIRYVLESGNINDRPMLMRMPFRYKQKRKE
jgi:hypothetical protein